MIDAMFGRSQIPKISHRAVIPRYYLGVALVVIAILSGLLVMLWAKPAVEVGNPLGSKVESLQQEIERKNKVIATLEKEREELRLQITKMEQVSQIDRESLSRAQDELKAGQDERLKMEEELVFLKSMVSTKSGKSALRVQRLRILPGKSENRFSYAFTISKMFKDPKYIEGRVYMVITGEKDGIKRSLPLNEVSKTRQKSLKMRFKHFQNIEGEFILPGRFNPSGVTIEVKPTGKKFKPLKKSFEWMVTG